jgi:hypothetical protein
MLHRELGQDRRHRRDPDVIADKVDVVEAGVPSARPRKRGRHGRHGRILCIESVQSV